MSRKVRSDCSAPALSLASKPGYGGRGGSLGGEGKALVRGGDGALAPDVTLNLLLTCCVTFAKRCPLWALVSPLVK